MSYGVFVKDSVFDEAYKWCVDTFGDEYDYRWYVDIEPITAEELIFKRQEDATIFMLRWL
jgi:hypothetical protein